MLLWNILLALLPSFVARHFEEKQQIKRRPYVPLNRELAGYRRLAERYALPTGGGNDLWQRRQDEGLTNSVPDALKREIKRFYDADQRQYETAYFAYRQWLETQLRKWDREHGTPPGGIEAVDAVAWFEFLAERECEAPNIYINEGQGLRIWDWCRRSQLFGEISTPQRFLRERWNETTHEPTILNYRECRQVIIDSLIRISLMIEKE